MAGQMDMGAILGEQLLNAAKIMEEQVDQEIKDLEKLDEDDLEAIRRRKLGECLIVRYTMCQFLTDFVYLCFIYIHSPFRHDEEDAREKDRMESCRSRRVFGDSRGERVFQRDQEQ